ncbi:MAG: hypothetical protein QF828_21270 [Pseudomonadales bacterium]|nr:hypothetical protein [Pseudomonadales bacterium]
MHADGRRSQLSRADQRFRSVDDEQGRDIATQEEGTINGCWAIHAPIRESRI